MRQNGKLGVLRQAVAVVATSAAGLAMTIGGASAAEASTPVFVTNTVDETVFFAQTSAVCGFPVYEHDAGSVTTKVTTMPDGSVKSQDVVVKITVTFYSTDPAHSGTVTTRPAGPFIEIDHPDGSVTEKSIGQSGHVAMRGSGLVWGDIGITRVEVDAAGDVSEVAHGNFSPDHTGICPLL